MQAPPRVIETCEERPTPHEETTIRWGGAGEAAASATAAVAMMAASAGRMGLSWRDQGGMPRPVGSQVSRPSPIVVEESGEQLREPEDGRVPQRGWPDGCSI